MFSNLDHIPPINQFENMYNLWWSPSSENMSRWNLAQLQSVSERLKVYWNHESLADEAAERINMLRIEVPIEPPDAGRLPFADSLFSS